MLYGRDLRHSLLWCSFSAEPLQNGQRRWRDGSLEEDLPMRSLSEMFNVNYFLVSQTNPHIVPVLNLKKRVNRKLGNLLEAEWKHRCLRCRHFSLTQECDGPYQDPHSAFCTRLRPV